MKFKQYRNKYIGFLLILVLGLMLTAQVVYSTGTVSVNTRVITDNQWSRGIREIKWSWVCTDATTSAVGGTVSNVTGAIWGIKAVPGTGNQAPDGDYDIAILDIANGMDVLNSDGANFPVTPSNVGNIRVPADSQNTDSIVLVNETLYFSGTNLTSASASGVIYLYILLP